MSKIFGGSDKQLPFVSVAIPAFNEEASLPVTLKSLAEQDYKGRFEIVIADNNSADKTSQIANDFGCVVILETQKGSRFAYQAAMSNAKGDPILVTNADSILPQNWISAIVNAYLEDPEIIGVGTRVKFTDGPVYLNFLLDLINVKLNGGQTFWGPSMSSTKEAFTLAGGINHGYNTNEDGIFTLLLKRLGKVIVLEEPVVYMSGRRFKGNVLIAFWRWLSGIGFNSVYIQLQYVLTGRIKGLIVDFNDVRTPKKLRNPFQIGIDGMQKSMRKSMRKSLQKSVDQVKKVAAYASKSVK